MGTSPRELYLRFRALTPVRQRAVAGLLMVAVLMLVLAAAVGAWLLMRRSRSSD